MGTLDYRALAVLDAVASQGSFEKAALALGISQSAVSQRIKALEDATGRLLIVRGQPAVPTGLGQRLVSHHRNVKLMEAALDIDLGRTVSLPDLAIAVEAGTDRQGVLDQVRAASGGLGVDVVVTAAASRPAQEGALALLAPGGRLSLFGGLARGDSMISIDSNLVHYRELTVVGVNGSSPAHNREALRLIASGEVVVADLVTHSFPLERLHDALEAIASGEAIKVTIEPHRDDRPTTHD